MPRCASSVDLLLDVVELGDEHLAERARVDEAQLAALRERDDDVRVLRHRRRARSCARGAGPTCRGGSRARRRRRASAGGTCPRRSTPVIFLPTSRFANCLRLWCRRTARMPSASTALDLLADDLASRGRGGRPRPQAAQASVLTPTPSRRRTRPSLAASSQAFPRDARRRLLGRLLRPALAGAVRLAARAARWRRSASSGRGPRGAPGSAGSWSNRCAASSWSRVL